MNYFIESINHFFSIDLLKRTIQKMLFIITKNCIKRKTINSWNLFIREHFLAINIKTIKIHNYTSTQLMLKFEFQFRHYDVFSIFLFSQTKKKLFEHQYYIFIALRDEQRLLTFETISYIHNYFQLRQRKTRISKIENLMLIRYHELDKQHEKKLEIRWLKSRLLIE